MSYKPVGKYIQLIDNRNKDLAVTNLLGINITKNFMPSVANVSGTDLSKYKIIEKGQFAYSAMQVGRDETIRISLYTDDEPAIISPAYSVIEVIDEKELLPEYMMMWFQRPESDRYGWFISDSSVRASLDYDRLCEIEIPIPHIDEQRKYVNLYKGLLNNQKTYENSLEDLQLICDTYIEDLIKTQESKTLGTYIQQSDERNTDLEIDNLLGISVNKVFMPSKANQNGLNLSNYKIVRERQFGYVSVTSRNGEKISIALLEGEAGIVSSTYTVFEVIDKTVLLPEYLFLFFKRSEFDRYARFNSWGSARETFDWSEMCRVQLPIPDIKIQEAIVTIYHTLEARKRINKQLKDSIKPLCPVLMRGVVEMLESNLKEVSYEI
ncbi:restriction endonuclease subunit S [Zunongwangia atlantica]|uniref:Restriction endonuclease S subunit n=1 Tax=Zunongwangia atlantica 22II14-10F7 TaxID=1185767 RepID=A0A1Y1T1T2_9FLAO|nr:restriction endonuclease subunit S [Zunongwangia atlantica]ORL44957.1 restriction endonuclease S subunit [Zunongwangia atlantica 22II14-10F7]